MRQPLTSTAYAAAIQLWLSLGKPIRSWWFNRILPEAPLDRSQIPTDSLDAYAGWLKNHTRWVADPLGGLWDVYPSEGHLGWQLQNLRHVEDDCDGLAYFAALTVGPLVDPGSEPYVVSVTLGLGSVPLSQSVHALCFFKRDGRWRVISNGELDGESWVTFAEALHLNSYCAGKLVVGREVRDAQLRRVPTPSP
jgi:hypothetical protein